MNCIQLSKYWRRSSFAMSETVEGGLMSCIKELNELYVNIP